MTDAGGFRSSRPCSAACACGEYTTYAVAKSDPSKPDYVTDSAASGTGWSTGHKT
jgi:alkaline phosphatase